MLQVRRQNPSGVAAGGHASHRACSPLTNRTIEEKSFPHRRALVKKSRFSEKRMISILKEADVGTKVADLCRNYGMSDAPYNRNPDTAVWTPRNCVT
jgi:hypothetical protein